ncbi:energy transducer TonB [Morganella morganii]
MPGNRTGNGKITTATRITVTGRTGNCPPEDTRENSQTTVRKTGSKSGEQKNGEIRTDHHTNHSGEDKTTQQQSGGQAISRTNSVTAGTDNRKAHEDYFNLLRQKIEEQKHYPRRARSAGQRGISTITFSLDDNGKPFAPAVIRSSGYELLDNAAMDAVIRVAAVGTPPQGAKRKVTFSLRFQLNNDF